MEKTSWTDSVRNEEVLRRVEENRNMLRTIKRRTFNWFARILCRNCHLKHVIEGRIEERNDVSGRRERRCWQLLDAVKEERRYWKLKDEARCGKFSLEETGVPSYDRLHNERNTCR
jgi:arginyl-tRNA--protein-N-Asp/Glu arginylyltransferase